MSVTVEIPGGTAELYERKELTPRRTLPYKALINRSDDLWNKIAIARSVTSPSGEVEENPGLDGPAHRLTQHEAETLEYLQYASTWGWLKSWTIDLPFPTKWEDLLDVPDEITEALNLAIQKRGKPAPDATEDFEMTPETLADKESFTGASEKRKTQSGANAKRRTSTRKPSIS